MKRPYYGWWVVIMTILVMTILLGIIFSSFGLFVIPVSKEFGLSRAEMNSAMILLSVGGAIASPLAGRLLDILAMKPVMLASAVGLGASLVTLGLSHSLWLDILLLLVAVPFMVPGAGNMSMPILIARWFDTQRGRAMALGMTGMALAAMIIPPLMSLLIQHQGWRTTLIISGCAAAALLSLIFLTVRDRPATGELEPASPSGSAAAPTMVERRLKPLELLRMLSFWIISGSTAISMGVGVGVQLSLVPLALDGGMTMITAATLLSAAGAGSLAGTLLLATFADRVNREVLLGSMFLCLGALMCIPLVGHSYAMLTTMAFGVGVCGASFPLFYAMLADRFGPASFGTAQGLSMPIIALSSAAGARFAGEVYDRTGSYDVMFATFCICQIIAALSILAIRNRRAPVSAVAPSHAAPEQG